MNHIRIPTIRALVALSIALIAVAFMPDPTSAAIDCNLQRDLEDDGGSPASVALVPVADDSQSGMEVVPEGTTDGNPRPLAPERAPVTAVKPAPLAGIATATVRTVTNTVSIPTVTSPDAPVPTPMAMAAPTARATPIIASIGSFEPSGFIGKGDAYNCNAFSSQAQAQAVLRADPRDPNKLDPDRDGVTCESNRAPKDTSPVKR